jgi:pimeloyl-ACP methyl ester carboxylesterase
MREYVTSSDGTRIGCTSIGSGDRKIVIVPGGLAAASDWHAVAHAVATACTCILVERRGRGASGDNPVHSLQKERDDIVAVLSEVGPDAILFGHSYSAVCALEAALIHPLRKLVLYEPPMHAKVDPISERLQALIDEGKNAAMVRLFLIKGVELPERAVDALERSPFWTDLVALAPTFPREARALEQDLGPDERYAAIKVPTLLVVGERSSPGLRDATKRLAPVLPNATIRELPGQGHTAHRTGPSELAASIVDFL